MGVAESVDKYSKDDIKRQEVTIIVGGAWV